MTCSKSGISLLNLCTPCGLHSSHEIFALILLYYHTKEPCLHTRSLILVELRKLTLLAKNKFKITSNMIRSKFLQMKRGNSAEKSFSLTKDNRQQNDHEDPHAVIKHSSTHPRNNAVTRSSSTMNLSFADSTLSNYLHTIHERTNEEADDLDQSPSLEKTFEDDDDDSISTVSMSILQNSSNVSLDEAPSVANLQSFARPFSIVFHDDDDDELSYSSINTEAFKEIKDLRNKLNVQENSKMMLIKQLQEKMANDISSSSSKGSMMYIKALKRENNELRESFARTEMEFMNKICEMGEKLAERDDRIAELEEKLAMLTMERMQI